MEFHFIANAAVVHHAGEKINALVNNNQSYRLTLMLTVDVELFAIVRSRL
jgi:hypothetical protein